MTPEQRKRLDEAREKWRADQRHRTTCNHVSGWGGGSMIGVTDDGFEIYDNEWTCHACKARIHEIIEMGVDENGEFKKRTRLREITE